MNLGLRGKVAFVAASSKGLGRAIAEELAAEGASLFLCARGEDALYATRDSIAQSFGVDIFAVPGDVSDQRSVSHMARAATERFGRIDILVMNSGGPPSGTFETLGADKWREAADLLLMSAVNLTSALLPQMKQRGWGRIINVTSIAVKQPVEGLILSNSLRAAVTGFARTLANEVAPHGITVNNIMPGYTRTDRVLDLGNAIAERDGITLEEANARWEREIPMRRLGEPREIAALAAFLASERASYLTGTSIAVDGGWTKSLL